MTASEVSQSGTAAAARSTWQADPVADRGKTSYSHKKTRPVTRHRDDIDGLRAVAVVPVVAFHYGMTRVASGGYVGVDIFFVISGFLITQLILPRSADKAYDIGEFYARRSRRIFPALVAVYLACIGASFVLQFPSEMRLTANAIIASILFFSNVYFAQHASYFDEGAAASPLLHTWSLSVEEQFYVIFPICIFGLRRLAVDKRAYVLWSLFVLSLAASVWAVRAVPTQAFYLVQYRAWELLLGSLLAVGALPLPRRQWLAEAVALSGMVLVAVSVHQYTALTSFPGLAAVPPCVGAAMIIAAGSNTTNLTSRLLALPPVRFIGLVSYSLYLWHWPVLIYGRLIREPNNLGEKFVLIGLSLALATLSWRFIEKPFRTRTLRFRNSRVIAVAASVMVAVGALALTAAGTSAAFWHMDPRAEKLLTYLEDNSTADIAHGCFLDGSAASFSRFDPANCLKLDPQKPNILLMGDSHAAHLVVGLKTAFPDDNLLVAVSIGCKPFIEPTGAPGCVALNRYVLDDFLPRHRLDEILLSGRWNQGDIPRVVNTIAALKPHAGRVVVSGPIVEYDQPLPRLLARSFGGDAVAYAAAHRRPEQAVIDQALETAVTQAGGVYVSPYRALCTPTCTIWASPDVPLQFDYGHLTREGSRLLAQRIEAAILNSSD